MSYEIFRPGYRQAVKSLLFVYKRDADFIYRLSTTAKLITFLLKTRKTCLKVCIKLSIIHSISLGQFYLEIS